MSITDSKQKRTRSTWDRIFQIQIPADEDSTIVAHFLHSFFHFWGFMTGVAIVTTLGLIGAGGNVLWTVGAALIAYVVLYIIGYWIWKGERDRSEQLSLELEQVKDKLSNPVVSPPDAPLLAGYIKVISFSPAFGDSEDDGTKRLGSETRVTVNIGFSNHTKVATSVLGFQLQVEMRNKPPITVSSLPIPKDEPYENDDLTKDLTTFLLRGGKSLKRGRHHDGWLTFYVPIPFDELSDQNQLNNPQYTVIVIDSFQNRHYIQEGGNPSGQIEFPRLW